MRKSLISAERLSDAKAIKCLFQHGKRVEGIWTRLVFLANGKELNRVLVTVKKGFKSAVARNRQKRVVREIYRLNKEMLKAGFDIALVVKKEQTDYHILAQEVILLFRHAGMWSSL